MIGVEAGWVMTAHSTQLTCPEPGHGRQAPSRLPAARVAGRMQPYSTGGGLARSVAADTVVMLTARHSVVTYFIRP